MAESSHPESPYAGNQGSTTRPTTAPITPPVTPVSKATINTPRQAPQAPVMKGW